MIVVGKGELDLDCVVILFIIFGNVNGDCEFFVGDVSYILMYVVGFVIDGNIEIW